MEENVENSEATLSSPWSLRSSVLRKAIMSLSISLTCLIVVCFTAPYLATLSIFLLTTILLVLSNTKSLSLHGEELVDGRGSNMEKVAGHCDSACQGEVSHLEACEVEATGFPSDSETTEESSGNEIFELGWSCPSNLGRSLVVSESESSDFDGDEDDDLIEIYLSEGDLDGCIDGSKLKLAEFICGKDTGPMDILEDEIEEVNEDDGLIEIDLSMGSIKCSGGGQLNR